MFVCLYQKSECLWWAGEGRRPWATTISPSVPHICFFLFRQPRATTISSNMPPRWTIQGKTTLLNCILFRACKVWFSKIQPRLFLTLSVRNGPSVSFGTNNIKYAVRFHITSQGTKESYFRSVRIFCTSRYCLGRKSKHKTDVTAWHGIHFHKNNLWNILVIEYYYVNFQNYQNSMLLTSSNTRRTRMHLFLFTNSAQRELVSICT